jgi:acyl-coenzyme A thioesterase PaaI-like protein
MKAALLATLVKKARYSHWSLFVLNLLLARTIPFNAPHRFRIREVGEDKVVAFAPYRKRNFNHIRGIHACAIATVAEFSAGLMLLTKLDPAKYRIIMARLDARYFYQAKKDIIARAELSTERAGQEVISVLEKNESATIDMTTTVQDVSQNSVAEVTTSWQVKRWDKVRTKV